MTISRIDALIRRHRFRPVLDLALPLIVAASVAFTATGIGSAGNLDRMDPGAREAPNRADCVHITGFDRHPA